MFNINQQTEFAVSLKNIPKNKGNNLMGNQFSP